MRSNWETSFDLVVGHEGGYTDDPKDKGNWTGGEVGSGELKGTKFGISAMSYPNRDIPKLTMEEARDIYNRDYWDRCSCDDLPSGVDYLVFDTAVNQGPIDSIKFLQMAAGVTADGVFGPITSGAVYNSDPIDLIEEFGAHRMYDYMQLTSLIPRYGFGWSRRLIESVSTAVLMSNE